MALFLFFTISCQKQELVIPNKEYQEVVYNFTLEGGNDDSIQPFAVAAEGPSCACRLTAKSNVNTLNTVSSPASDWKVSAKFQTGVNPNTFQTIAQFGQGQTPYTGSDNTFGGALGTQEQITFIPPSNSFQLIVHIPNSTIWDSTEIRAGVHCENVNTSGGVSITHYGGGSPLNTEYGDIIDCSVYPANPPG